MHIKPYFKALHLWATVQLRKEEIEVFNQPLHTQSSSDSIKPHPFVCKQQNQHYLCLHTKKIFALLPSKAH